MPEPPPLPPRRDPVAGAMFRGLDWLVRHGLRGVWWRGELPAGPFVWAANHHSWWDPFVAAALLQRFRRVGCLLMDQDNLERYQFVRRLGVFGTNQHRAGLGYLRAGRVLVIYPEGRLLPAGPAGPLAGGAAWFAKAARVPLYAAATRVLLRGQQTPEAYVSLVPVAPGSGAAGATDRTAADPSATTGRLADALQTELAALAEHHARTDPREPLPGFTPVVAGQRSWDERIDRVGQVWSRRPGRRRS